MKRLALAAVAALFAAVGAPVSAQTAVPAAPTGAAVVLEAGQGTPGGGAGVTGSVSGIDVQDAVLETIGELLQARGVAVHTAQYPGMPVLDVAWQVSVGQQQVLLAARTVVSTTLYARLTNPDGSVWYAHGAGSATVTALTNPYGYGGYWGQVPAGAVLDAVRRAAAELVPQVVVRLGAAPAPPPCSGTRTAAQ